jgi:hypothetical protein
MAKRLSHGQHADGVNGAVVGAPPMLTNRFLAAIALATEIHGHERRMGTEIPYLAHLLVARRRTSRSISSSA